MKACPSATRVLALLHEDHDILRAALDELDQAVAALRAAPDLVAARPSIREALAATRQVVAMDPHEQCEEDALFPAMRSVQADGGIHVRTVEHTISRRRRRRLVELLERPDALDFPTFRERVHENARAVVPGLRRHLEQEERVLYPLALRTLDEPSWDEVERRFAQIRGGSLGGPGRPST